MNSNLSLVLKTWASSVVSISLFVYVQWHIGKSGSCTTELPILLRGPTHFVDVYPELVLQRDVSTQADMFLACSSPKEPCTPVSEDNSAVSFTDDTYVNIILLLL